MATIDIIVAVDGDQLQEQVNGKELSAGTKAAPTYLGSWTESDVFISMIAQQQFVSNDSSDGSSELTVTCNSGDTIRWRMTTFSSNTDTCAFIYGGKFTNALNNGKSVELSPLTLLSDQNTVNIPNESGTLTAYNNQLYFAQATVLGSSQKLQYYMDFELVDSTGTSIGYFQWDPFIVVNA